MLFYNILWAETSLSAQNRLKFVVMPATSRKQDIHSSFSDSTGVIGNVRFRHVFWFSSDSDSLQSCYIRCSLEFFYARENLQNL